MAAATLGVSQNTTDAPSIGLLAAWGRFPLAVAEALKADGYRVCCLGVKDHADRTLEEVCDEFAWVGLAKLGAAAKWFSQQGVTQATMAGKIHKVKLMQPWSCVRHLPDWTTVKAFYPHFIARSSDRKDDTLLLAVVDTFAKRGIEFLPATNFAPKLLIGPGLITGRRLSAAESEDIEFGWRLAKQMGGMDVGQSVCVKGQAVLAIEAIEGTDQAILRAGELCKQGGFTVVKVAKPGQDMRFDVPTVGVRTLQTMQQAGAKVLAIESGRTILLDNLQFCDYAKAHGLTVTAIDPSPPNLRLSAG